MNTKTSGTVNKLSTLETKVQEPECSITFINDMHAQRKQRWCSWAKDSL